MYGAGSGPIALDSVVCFGNEDRLLDCLYTLDTTEDTHMMDAGVFCYPRKFHFLSASITTLHGYEINFQ